MKAHKLSPVKLPLAKLSPGKVPKAPGVYILYRTNMGAPAYVGRDDYHLYEALKTHKKAGVYRYFKFMRCSNPDDAFQWECLFWHKGQATIDNSEAKGGRHPKPPQGRNIDCPYPGCTYQSSAPAPSPSTVVEAPVAEAPPVSAPVTEAPPVAAPVAEAPAAEAPVAEAPSEDAPETPAMSDSEE